MTIQVLPGDYAVCQLPTDSQVVDFPGETDLMALIRTPEEVTVIALEEAAPLDARSETGWRVFKVVGPLDFSLVGILAHLAGLLAEAEISIFALSTYDTDYLLVKADHLQAAREALTFAGHEVI